MLTVWQWNGTVLSVLPYGQQMVKQSDFVVEAHFVPLPANEADERTRRFRALFLRGFLRCVQKHTDRGSQPDGYGAAQPLPLDLMQK